MKTNSQLFVRGSYNFNSLPNEFRLSFSSCSKQNFYLSLLSICFQNVFQWLPAKAEEKCWQKTTTTRRFFKNPCIKNETILFAWKINGRIGGGKVFFRINLHMKNFSNIFTLISLIWGKGNESIDAFAVIRLKAVRIWGEFIKISLN